MNDESAAADDQQNEGAQASEQPAVVDPMSGIKVFLKARILKDQSGFHKLVYSETVSQVNGLIESLVNRGKENNFTRKNVAPAANSAAAAASAANTSAPQ